MTKIKMVKGSPGAEYCLPCGVGHVGESGDSDGLQNNFHGAWTQYLYFC